MNIHKTNREINEKTKHKRQRELNRPCRTSQHFGDSSITKLSLGHKINFYILILPPEKNGEGGWILFFAFYRKCAIKLQRKSVPKSCGQTSGIFCNKYCKSGWGSGATQAGMRIEKLIVYGLTQGRVAELGKHIFATVKSRFMSAEFKIQYSYLHSNAILSKNFNFCFFLGPKIA